MLDIRFIRENPDKVRDGCRKRQVNADIDGLLAVDKKRRKLLQEAEELKAKRNKFSKTKPDEKIIKKVKVIGEKIKELNEQLRKIENEYIEKLSELPNMPADDVAAGGEENNKVIRTFGKKPGFGFNSKDHIELVTDLKLVDYKRAAKMSGAGFWCYTGRGALIEWALLNYFVDFHNKNKYYFILPPYLLNEQSAYASGHLPKFRDDLFWTQDKTCLNATAEMMLVNYHRDEILSQAELPKKYFAFAPSFRREAGSYRKEERGMIRGHQFHKIEMFQFTKPGDSWQAFDELVKNAEEMVKGIGLHYQVSQLAAGDCSTAMAKTIDIEVWIPSIGVYKEVSSISNALDYQARRANIRFKNSENKNEFVHTLNASGLATSRLVPAILEQNQQKDGSVTVPEALRKYMDGIKKITS